MKIKAVTPGTVSIKKDGQFGFSVYYDTDRGTKVSVSEERFVTANEAKQAMREKVAAERKRHMVE